MFRSIRQIIKYYWFCLKWLYKNREWNSTRQKYKALDRAWSKYRGVGDTK